jgi:lipocalin
MLQIDPWVKAAECERAIRVVADPERRSVFISLRSLWIALGNKETIFNEPRQTGQVPMIAQIHAELMSLYRDAMN